MDRMEALQNELTALRLAHRFYRDMNLYPDEATKQRGERLCGWEFAGKFGQPEFQEFRQHPRFLDWQIARASLVNNPNAPLPGEEGHVPLPLKDPERGRAEANAQGTAFALRMIQSREAAE